MSVQQAYLTSNDILEEVSLLRDSRIQGTDKLKLATKVKTLFPNVKSNTNPDIKYIVEGSKHTQQYFSINDIEKESIRRNFSMLQQWEGKVTSVSEETFAAIITNRTDPDKPQEVIEMELEEIPQDDMSLLKPGAFFYWSIGYEDAPGIPRQRVSRIRFRRLPAWTDREINQAKQKAKYLLDLF